MGGGNASPTIPGEGSSTDTSKKGVLTFEWSNLPVSLLRAFLVLIPDEDGWDVEARSVMAWSHEECVAAVEKYDRSVDLSLGSGFFWPTELRNALELEANVEVFSVDDDDLAVLASVESEQNKKKRDDARKKVAAMSPGSKARALVRPPSRQEAKRKGARAGDDKVSDEAGSKRQRPASGDKTRPVPPPELVDTTDETGMLAIQGEKSVDVLQPLVQGCDLSSIKYYRFDFGTVCGLEGTRISRTGYTG